MRHWCGFIFREVSDLIKRKYVSDYHKRAWFHFEKLLYVRTMMFMTSRTVLFIISNILKDQRYNQTDEYFDEGGPPELERAKSGYPYAKFIYISLMITRAILLILAFKWHWLTKTVLYLEFMLQSGCLIIRFICQIYEINCSIGFRQNLII